MKMADLEERMKVFLNTLSQDQHITTAGGAGDTFAERAEWFFRKRPQLLGLLKDLYNAYITLMDRCNQIENKHHFHQNSSLFSDQQQQQEEIIDTNWEIESSDLSYYHHHTPISTAIDDLESFVSYSDIISSSSSGKSKTGFDEIVSCLVMKMVEEEILKQQLGEMEQQLQESWRKIDILKKLIEVLESERVVLLNENGRLGYKVADLMEENDGLSSEAIFLRRKAAYLAKNVLKLREDHRVCVLTSKIENLQSQIYGLEKRNEEYYQQLLMQQQQQQKKKKKENSKRIEERRRMKNEFGLMGCFQMEKKMKFKKRNEGEEVKSGRKWWDKVKKGMDLQMFGIHGFSSSSTTSAT